MSDCFDHRRALITPRLRCGIVLRVQEDACQVLAEGQVVSVRYASQFPTPRRERVSEHWRGRDHRVASTVGGKGIADFHQQPDSDSAEYQAVGQVTSLQVGADGIDGGLDVRKPGREPPPGRPGAR